MACIPKNSKTGKEGPLKLPPRSDAAVEASRMDIALRANLTNEATCSGDCEASISTLATTKSIAYLYDPPNSFNFVGYEVSVEGTIEWECKPKKNTLESARLNLGGAKGRIIVRRARVRA